MMEKSKLGLEHRVCKFIEVQGDLCLTFIKCPIHYEREYCFKEPNKCMVYQDKLRYESNGDNNGK